MLHSGFEERFQKEANLCSSSIRPSLVKVHPIANGKFSLVYHPIFCSVGTEFYRFNVLLQPPEYMPENLTQNSAWMGGAILAKVVFPQNQQITKGDYDEMGPAIVHKKCF